MIIEEWSCMLVGKNESYLTLVSTSQIFVYQAQDNCPWSCSAVNDMTNDVYKPCLKNRMADFITHSHKHNVRTPLSYHLEYFIEFF